MPRPDKKILLSGVKPTGRPHLGNYFGAMKQFVKLQDEYDSHIFIADYHALTTLQNAKELSQNIIDIALDYLAIGLEPKKVTLFKQSDVPEVTELAWIFNCITTMPFLERAHAYKDAVAKGREVNVGTFDYPLLMAADILIQDADVVPVGADQKQHVEYARYTAEKFNRIFGETFKLPKEKILPEVAVIPGTDGKKMSKSYGNIIPLFTTDTEIEKLVMKIKTDSEKYAEDARTTALVGALSVTKIKGQSSMAGLTTYHPANVYLIHRLFCSEADFRSEAELAALYQSKAGKYEELKEELIADIKKFIKPLREHREKLAKDPSVILKILKSGGEKAQKIAEAKMKIVREKVGVNLY